MFRKCCLFLQGLNVHSRPQRALDEWQLTIEEHFWPHKVSYCFACTVFLCHICIPVPVPSGKHWLFLLLHCWCNWHQIILLLLCLLLLNHPVWFFCVPVLWWWLWFLLLYGIWYQRMIHPNCSGRILFLLFFLPGPLEYIYISIFLFTDPTNILEGLLRLSTCFYIMVFTCFPATMTMLILPFN